MQLGFEKVGITNFRTFSGKHVLKLAHRVEGLYYVKGLNEYQPRMGPNGVGKSSIFGAVCWCLFGTTVERLRNTDIRPWSKVKGGTEVSVTVTVDEEKHTIKRGASPNFLELDGRAVGQEQVVAIIGMDYDVFVNTVLFGQGQDLFFDRKPQDKMKLFSQVLDLTRWEQRSKIASTEASELEREAATIEGEITGGEQSLKSLESMLSSARMQSEEWESTRQTRLEGMQADLKKVRKELDTAQVKLGEAEIAQDEAGTKAKLYRADLNNYTNAAAIARANVKAAQSEITRYEDEVERLRSELTDLGEADMCPVCEQSLKGTNLAKHKRDIKNKIADLREKIDAGIPKRVVLTAAEAAANLQKLITDCEALDNQASDSFSAVKLQKERVGELQSRLNSLLESRTDSEEQDNPHTETIRDLTSRKKKLAVQLREDREYLAKLRRKIERTRFWIKGFKDVRLYVIDSVLQELELTTNAMLEEMGLIGWRIQYAVEKETASGSIQRGLVVTVLSPENEKPVRWECWSGGEAQRLRICGALALSEVLLNHAGVGVDVEVLDEPTRGLSLEGRRDICSFLAGRAKQLGRRIFYVDHTVVESAEFEDTITVLRDDAGSHIVE